MKENVIWATNFKLLSQIKENSINNCIFKVVVSVRSPHCDYMPRDLKVLDNCTTSMLRNFLHGSTALLIQGLFIIEVSRSHSDAQHSTGRMIGRSQRPLPDNTRHKKYPCPRRDSNPLSQQASG